MIRFFLIIIGCTVTVSADPERVSDVPFSKKPYMQYYEPQPVLSSEFKALRESMSGAWWNYKVHLSAVLHLNTPGYKRQKFVNYQDETGTIIPTQYIDWARERPKDTGHPLDIYVSGKLNMFCLEPMNGVELYTFDGRFYREKDGRLFSLALKRPVLGTDGYIYLETNSPVVDDTGKFYENDAVVGQLKIASFKSPNGLWTVDGSVFYKREPTKVQLDDSAMYYVLQGYQEIENEPPGMKTTTLIAPIAEATAKSTKKLIESYQLMFRAVMD